MQTPSELKRWLQHNGAYEWGMKLLDLLDDKQEASTIRRLSLLQAKKRMRSAFQKQIDKSNNPEKKMTAKLLRPQKNDGEDASATAAGPRSPFSTYNGWYGRIHLAIADDKITPLPTGENTLVPVVQPEHSIDELELKLKRQYAQCYNRASELYNNMHLLKTAEERAVNWKLFDAANADTKEAKHLLNFYSEHGRLPVVERKSKSTKQLMPVAEFKTIKEIDKYLINVINPRVSRANKSLETAVGIKKKKYTDKLKDLDDYREQLKAKKERLGQEK